MVTLWALRRESSSLCYWKWLPGPHSIAIRLRVKHREGSTGQNLAQLQLTCPSDVRRCSPSLRSSSSSVIYYLMSTLQDGKVPHVTSKPVWGFVNNLWVKLWFNLIK